jgi:hypothetical protein
MTDDERELEGAEESIEDLEVPATLQRGVDGGIAQCATPTCVGGTKVGSYCEVPTCKASKQYCDKASWAIIVYEQ